MANVVPREQYVDATVDTPAASAAATTSAVNVAGVSKTPREHCDSVCSTMAVKGPSTACWASSTRGAATTVHTSTLQGHAGSSAADTSSMVVSDALLLKSALTITVPRPRSATSRRATRRRREYTARRPDASGHSSSNAVPSLAATPAPE